jgi:hypothetical protein
MADALCRCFAAALPKWAEAGAARSAVVKGHVSQREPHRSPAPPVIIKSSAIRQNFVIA